MSGLKIAICGPGGSGKDTVAEWFGQNTTLKYKYSTSYIAREVVHEYIKSLGSTTPQNSITELQYPIYGTADECYADRANCRRLWADAIDRMNRHDPACLYRMCVEVQDILTGIRKSREFAAARKEGLFDLAIWLDSDTAADDPTQEYGSNYCDFIIQNKRGQLGILFSKLCRLSSALGILKPEFASVPSKTPEPTR